MNDQMNLYIRLEKPNNEYDNGKLIFESSLNMSINFRLFTANSGLAQFRDKIYLEITSDISDTKKWLVKKLSLRTLGINDKVINAFNKELANITGYNVDDFANLNPVTAWTALNKLVKKPLPYGHIWTDNKYLPTAHEERCGFKCDHHDNKWTFKENSGWSDSIFEIAFDKWGRPIFRFRPDGETWPATMECLLTDLEEFLFENRNSTGKWLINTILPDSQQSSSN